MATEHSLAHRFETGLVLFLVFALLSACAETKKSLTPQAQLATRIDTTIQDLGHQMSHCDLQHITPFLTPDLANDHAMTQSIETLCARAHTLQAQFVIERLWLQPPETVRVDLHWTLQVTLDAGPSTTIGTARFTMIGKDHPLISAVSGDNPFDPQFDVIPVP